MNNELLVFVDKLKIYFVPSWAELDPYNGIFLKKIYEPLPAFLPENCQLIIDCGANIGIYTLKAASCSTNRVFAIEPNPLVFSRLKKNIAGNNLNNVIALNIGLGSSKHSAKLFWERSTTGGTVRPESTSKEISSADIEISTLDEIMQVYKIDCVDLIKMDVEGNEYEALKGADNILRKTKSIILEFHSDVLKKRCEKLLMSYGFRKVYEIPEHQFYTNAFEVSI
jgi:FkbM family methyltransferase